AAVAAACSAADVRRADEPAAGPPGDDARRRQTAVRDGAGLLLLLLLLRVPRLVTVVPRLPLLAPWYRLVGDGDRLLLEHGQAVVVLEGGAARAFLPALLPLLDGTRSYDDLLDRLGVAARRALDLALDVLSRHGLLVEGPDAASDVRAAAHAV